MKCGCAARLWHRQTPERHIYCPLFKLLSTFKSIHFHKPLLGCIRVSANCSGMYNSSSPEGSGHRQQFLLHFTPAQPEMYETVSTFILHNLAGTLRASSLPSVKTIFTSKTITCPRNPVRRKSGGRWMDGQKITCHCANESAVVYSIIRTII